LRNAAGGPAGSKVWKLQPAGCVQQGNVFSSLPCTKPWHCRCCTIAPPSWSAVRWRWWTQCAPTLEPSFRLKSSPLLNCQLRPGGGGRGLLRGRRRPNRHQASGRPGRRGQGPAGSWQGEHSAESSLRRLLVLPATFSKPRQLISHECRRLSLFGGFQNATDGHPYALGSYLLEELNK